MSELRGEFGKDLDLVMRGFGETGRERLLIEYEAAGGRTWPPQ
jgi:hypothetical protein